MQKRQAFTRCLSGKVTRSMFQHSHLPISWQRDEVRKCKKKESTEKKQKNVQEIEKAFVQSWHLNQHGVKRKEERRRKETQERRGGRMKTIFFKKTQVKKTKPYFCVFLWASWLHILLEHLDHPAVNRTAGLKTSMLGALRDFLLGFFCFPAIVWFQNICLHEKHQELPYDGYYDRSLNSTHNQPEQHKS